MSYLTSNNIVTLKSGLESLKVIETGAIKSLGAVSYSPSIVTMAASLAVCEIFSVKEWCDVENRVRVRSRSLKVARFDDFLLVRHCNYSYILYHLRVI